jgi:hypothetical protein
MLEGGFQKRIRRTTTVNVEGLAGQTEECGLVWGKGYDSMGFGEGRSVVDKILV